MSFVHGGAISVIYFRDIQCEMNNKYVFIIIMTIRSMMNKCRLNQLSWCEHLMYRDQV